MKRLKFDRRKLLKFLATLAAVLLTLFLLVLIPLKTHREPVPDAKYTEHRPPPAETPEPEPTPEPTPEPELGTPVVDEDLQALLDEFRISHGGVWDLYILDLSRGQYASSCPEDSGPMIAASLIKLYIMGATYQKIQAGELSESMVTQLIQAAITVSDNACANKLLYFIGDQSEEVGMEAVNAFALSIGCADTRINRRLGGDNDLQNYTTAADCAQFLKLLYRYELLSPEYSAKMLNFLKMQRKNDRLPAYLPSGTVCAHKTGDLTDLCCGDVGLVFSPNADYIFSVICNAPERDAQAIQDIAELSLLVYEYFNPPETEEPEVSPAP